MTNGVGSCDCYRREPKIAIRFLKMNVRFIVNDKYFMKISIYYDFFLLRESYRTTLLFS